MTKAKMWVALATALAGGLAAVPLTDAPGWVAGLVTAAVGALGALSVYRVPNKELPSGPVHYRDEPYNSDEPIDTSELF